ncbi:MAG: PAS domain-containing protein, partial [Candidatus Moraniibacteriota bacterium]
DFNYAAEKLEGIKKEEILGKNIKDIFSGVEKMGLLGVFKRVYKTGKSEDSPLKFYQDDKIVGWRNNFIYKLPTGDIVAIYEDVTAQKKAEEDILETKSVLDSIVHSTKDGILAVDMQGRIRFLNDKFKEMWGVPQKIVDSKEDRQLLNFVLDQLIDSDKFLEKVNYLYKNNNKESLDLVYFKDGRIFERYSRPQKVGNKIIGRIWDFRDITNQKKAEEMIMLDEERFEEIFNYSPIAIELYNSKGELEKVNKATLEMFGVKNEKEIFGFKLFDDPNIPDNTKKALRNGEAVKYENVFEFERVQKFNLYNTNRKGTIQLNTAITPIKKGLAGYLVMIEDITNNKESQIKLQEKLEEMEKMNKLMIGRELKMIELKNKIEEANLKTKE